MENPEYRSTEFDSLKDLEVNLGHDEPSYHPKQSTRKSVSFANEAQLYLYNERLIPELKFNREYGTDLDGIELCYNRILYYLLRPIKGEVYSSKNYKIIV
jgi:hypothetical protein